MYETHHKDWSTICLVSQHDVHNSTYIAPCTCMVLQGARLACDLLLDMHEEAIIRLDEANYDAIIMI